MALRMLCIKLGLSKDVYSSWKTLAQLQGHLNKNLAEMGELVKQHLNPKPMTRKEIEAEIGMDLEELISDVPAKERVLSENEDFHP